MSDPTSPAPQPEDARVRIGQTEFIWPAPDKQVRVGSRTLSLEVLVVAGLYAFAALWLAFALRDSIEVLPDILSGLFDEFSFIFAISWLFLAIFSMLWYVVFALGYTAVRTFLLDPLGRGLSAVISGFLALLVFTEEAPGSMWAIMLISVACTAVLYLSPWARRALASSKRRYDRPEPVVLAEAVAVSWFSLLALVAVMLLPGFRFVGDLGIRFVLFELLVAAACVLAFTGRVKMKSEPRSGRLLLTVAAVGTCVGYLFVTGGNGVAVGLAVLAAIMLPLWAAPSAREFFGDKPLGMTSGPTA